MLIQKDIIRDIERCREMWPDETERHERLVLWVTLAEDSHRRAAAGAHRHEQGGILVAP